MRPGFKSSGDRRGRKSGGRSESRTWASKKVRRRQSGGCERRACFRVGCYDASSGLVLHHLMQALRARFIYEKERDYVVLGGEVLIVDPFTGRTLPSQCWSEGLHQAIEAKEGRVEIRPETRTLASPTRCAVSPAV